MQEVGGGAVADLGLQSLLTALQLLSGPRQLWNLVAYSRFKLVKMPVQSADLQKLTPRNLLP